MLGHTPVLLQEVLTLLAPGSNQDTVDATLGAGGHARAILEKTAPDGKFIGIDRDPLALQTAAEVLEPFGPRARLIHDSFDHLSQILSDVQFPPVDCLLADLGLSSLELSDPVRGFSFNLTDSPLDLRFDPTSGQTAADLIRKLSAKDLAQILFDYGEERASRRIAAAIVQARRQHDLSTVGNLVEVITSVVPRRGRLHPATRTFQALRIAVNDELGQLERFLPQAIASLAPNGRLAIISFHSLEDRIVKHFFRRMKAEGQVEILTKHPVIPGSAEITTNPRSRSAKLRVVVRRPTAGKSG